MFCTYTTYGGLDMDYDLIAFAFRQGGWKYSRALRRHELEEKPFADLFKLMDDDIDDMIIVNFEKIRKNLEFHQAAFHYAHGYHQDADGDA